MASRGLFITFEGTEGSGKSTQIQLLAEHLRSLGREVVVLREPGGTPIGEEVRHLLKHSDSNRGMTPECELLLMNAARAQLVREIIRPALEAGKTILCDRFFDSTTVYQGQGRGLDAGQVRSIVDFAIDGVIPDLTILLMIPLEVSEERRALRDSEGGAPRDRFEEADRAFFKRVEQGYERLAKAEGNRVVRIDATGATAAIAARIRECLESL